jgi:hypothetical protein
MSWDKNTVNLSELEATRKVLDDLGIPYQISVIAKFEGRGVNDEFEGHPIYELKRLQYFDKVILEYVNLHPDCDIDDIIYSEKFSLEDEPKNWEPIRRLLDED